MINNISTNMPLLQSLDDPNKKINKNIHVIDKKDVLLYIKYASNFIYNVVKNTFGPTGSYVLVSSDHNKSFATKDGVTVIKHMFHDDPIYNLIFEVIKSAAINTLKSSGDGTTSTMILLNELINRGFDIINKYYDEGGFISSHFTNGMNDALKDIDYVLNNLSFRINKSVNNKDVNETKKILLDVIKTASNSDYKIVNTFESIFNKIGINGLIEIEESPSNRYTDIIYYDGFKIDGGYISKVFVNDEASNSCKLERCALLIYDGYLKEVSENLGNLIDVILKNNMSFVIFLNDISKIAQQQFITSVLNSKAHIVVIKNHSLKEIRKKELSDLSAVTGAKIINELSINDINEEILGVCDSIIVKQFYTLIKRSNLLNDVLNEYINSIKDSYDTSILNDQNKYYKHLNRLANLDGKSCLIKVGGSSEEEVKELFDRFEDSLFSFKTAIEDGIVPGAGVSLLLANKIIGNSFKKTNNKYYNDAYKLVIDSLPTIFNTLLSSTGIHENKILKIKKSLLDGENNSKSLSYDILNDSIATFMNNHVIDSKKVVFQSVKNAISIALILLLSKSLIKI